MGVCVQLRFLISFLLNIVTLSLAIPNEALYSLASLQEVHAHILKSGNVIQFKRELERKREKAKFFLKNCMLASRYLARL